MIQHNKPTIGNDEISAASSVLKSEWLSAGKEVKKFENEFCHYLGLDSGSGVCVSSGSAAIYLILKALGFKNKTISIPSYTCVALKNAIDLSGNKILFIDTKENSFNIDINSQERNNSDFCVFPSMYGETPNQNELLFNDVAYDNCQSLGSKINNVPIGNFSEISLYSFYSTKIITSGGQGGIIVSRNKSLINEIKDIIYFDQKIDLKTRFNFQMTDIQASIGRVQLSRLEEFIEKREEIFNRYLRNGLKLKNFNSHSKKSNYYRAILEVKNNEKLINHLKKHEIYCINPLKKGELLLKNSKMNNSINLTKKFISLPIYPELTFDNVDLISNKIKEYI